jgi:FkbM family methyltransferase
VDEVTGARIYNVRSLTKIGSDYGGWIIPSKAIATRSICYCAGVGEDISFDLGIISRFNCEVFAFDPTPRAKAYVERHAHDVPKFHFSSLGVWNEDTSMKFYAPANHAHVSHSVLNLQKTASYFEGQCKRLSTIMNDNGHSRIDLLKLDIEGAEYKVIESILHDRLDIGIICVEYDEAYNCLDDQYLTRIKRSLSSLLDSGYALAAVEPRCNYTLVRNDVLRALGDESYFMNALRRMATDVRRIPTKLAGSRS